MPKTARKKPEPQRSIGVSESTYERVNAAAIALDTGFGRLPTKRLANELINEALDAREKRAARRAS